MIRLFGPGLLGMAIFGLWLYCIFDVVSTDAALVRNLPKVVWLVFVLLVPLIGSLVWLGLGRPPYGGWRPGDTSRRPPRRGPTGPDDDPDWRP
ncbi:MAG: PLDc N-terminal domain-containing protein [Actinomycetota bacterium]